MRRRLRKKTRRGEFKELGFQLHARHADASAGCPCCDGGWVTDLIQWLEARGLGCGGGGRPGGTDLYVAPLRRGSASDEDREATSAWLAARPEVAAHAVGPLTDAWHGPEAEHDLVERGLEASATPGGALLTLEDAARGGIGEAELAALAQLARWVTVGVGPGLREETEAFESLRRRGLASGRPGSYRLTAAGRRAHGRLAASRHPAADAREG